MQMRLTWLGLTSTVLIALLPVSALAYIGPGAGFTFVTSFFLVFVTFFLAFLTLLTWPVRWAIQKFRGRKALAASRVKRVVVVGLDGLDPELTDDFMKRGLLPNLERLASRGSYTRLRTTLPPESPVAWSSFSTGCNPGRHQVFDFLVPNRKSYLPELCASRIHPPTRTLSMGPYQIPLSKPRIQFERRSQSFWKILGDYGIYSTILRVPITFPPERFNGLQLSAMSVPDLKGSQGTFSYYTSDPVEQSEVTGGQVMAVKVENGAVQSYISGPENALRKDAEEMRIPFTVHLGGLHVHQGEAHSGAEAELELDGQRYALPLRQFTPWIPVSFRAGLGVRVQGICRFYLKAVEPYFQLYMTPINIDPGKPALPISYPFPFSMYLAKTQGHFTTLGLAEDTWALNERVLDEDAFMQRV